MSVRLLAIPASHPCAAVAAMLDAKGVEYERVDLFPALSRGWLRATGFAEGTVPALRVDGALIQGSRSIARALDARWPEPRLVPDDPAARARMEEIEAWGDGPLQAVTRRIVLWSLTHSRRGVHAALVGARLQFRFPVSAALWLSWPVLRLDAALNGARAEAVRLDLASLPGMLDQVDIWISSGDLGGAPPTAADYQVAGSLRLLLTLADLAPFIADRPAEGLARTLIPGFPGAVPAGVLPATWLP